MDAELLNTLESQHREAEDLISQLEDATEAAEQEPLVDKLITAMEEHMAIEEEQVYPELQRIDSEIAEEAETEHGLAVRRTGRDALIGGPARLRRCRGNGQGRHLAPRRGRRERGVSQTS